MSNAPYRSDFVPRDRSVMGGRPNAGSLSDGRLSIGELDPYDRPTLRNDNGSVSTTRSFSVEREGRETLLPSVINGERYPEKAVGAQLKQNLGTFRDSQTADGYASQLHNDQARRGGQPQDAPTAPIDTITGARMPDSGKLARIMANQRTPRRSR